MKKIFLVLFLVTLILGLGQNITYACWINPNTWSISVYPGSLDHSKYYTWGINWTLPAGKVITGATLTYYGIYDWTDETDTLFTHLLDTQAAGWSSAYDSTSGISDQFNGQGYKLGEWDDPNGGYANKIHLSYDIPSAYFNWLSDGNFGFGIDPDCHYHLCKIKFQVNYAPIPEPATLSLLGLGLLGLLGFKKRRNKP